MVKYIRKAVDSYSKGGNGAGRPKCVLLLVILDGECNGMVKFHGILLWESKVSNPDHA